MHIPIHINNWQSLNILHIHRLQTYHGWRPFQLDSHNEVPADVSHLSSVVVTQHKFSIEILGGNQQKEPVSHVYLMQKQ